MQLESFSAAANQNGDNYWLMKWINLISFLYASRRIAIWKEDTLFTFVLTLLLLLKQKCNQEHLPWTNMNERTTFSMLNMQSIIIFSFVPQALACWVEPREREREGKDVRLQVINQRTRPKDFKYKSLPPYSRLRRSRCRHIISIWWLPATIDRSIDR